MRCYLMQGGHIVAVKLLTVGVPDAEAIEEAKRAFWAAEPGKYDAFEVWDRTRFLYQYARDETDPGPGRPAP